MANFFRAMRDASAPAGVNRFIASTPEKARDGLSLKKDDWFLDNFRSNPVFLWLHNFTNQKLPIGAVRSVDFDAQERMIIDVDWDTEDTFAMQVKGKYDRGYLNTVSVRWNPVKINNRKMNDLLEISAVPVPGDPNAVAIREYREELEIYRTEMDELLSRASGPLDHSTLRRRLAEFVREKLTDYSNYYSYVVMTFDNFAIIEDERTGRFYKHPYSVDEQGNVTVDSTRSEVLHSWVEVSSLANVIRAMPPADFEKLYEEWQGIWIKKDSLPPVTRDAEILDDEATIRAMIDLAML